MVNLPRDDQLQREEKSHDRLAKLDEQHVTADKRQINMAAQVKHLTSTATSFRDQLDTNSDSAVDAIQQVRDEMGTRSKAMEQAHQDALNAGGRSSLLVAPGARHRARGFEQLGTRRQGHARYRTVCDSMFVLVRLSPGGHCRALSGL